VKYVHRPGLEEVHITANPNPLLRPVFVRYPYSHSLMFLVIWGAIFGLLWRARTHVAKALPVLMLLVVSHWVLDFVTHRRQRAPTSMGLVGRQSP
jgi:membrane-bound metal-dependent hydrolase YbcI (DUF457 family)